MGASCQALTFNEKVKVASMKMEDTAHLPDYIELAVGMKCMVTFNVATDVNLVNGSIGMIKDIFLDPREEPWREGEIVNLEYPPIMILFQPTQSCKTLFQGLQSE